MATDWRALFARREPNKTIVPQRRASIFSGPYDPQGNEPLVVMEHDISKTDVEKSWLYERLKSLTLFSTIDGSLFITLIKLMYSREVNKGDCILTESVAEHTFFVIQKGACNIYERRNGEISSGKLEENDCYNEVALLHKPKKQLSVTAATNGIVWFLERKHYTTVVAGQSYKEREEKLYLLKTMSLFKNLNESQTCALADAMKPNFYKDKEIMIPKCRTVTGLYFIREGLVTQSKPQTLDRPKNVIRRYPGQHIGLKSFTPEEVFTNGSVRARGDVLAWYLEKADVLRLVGPLEEE